MAHFGETSKKNRLTKKKKKKVDKGQAPTLSGCITDNLSISKLERSFA
jgi:hypothetical protein